MRTDWAEFLDRVFLSDVVVHLGESGGSVLDLGSGPSISSIIAASRWQKNFYRTLKSTFVKLKDNIGGVTRSTWQSCCRGIGRR